MNSCLCRLIIFLCFIVLSWQQETPVTESITASVTETVSPGEAHVSAATKASANKPQSTIQAPGWTPSSGSLNKLRVPVEHNSLNVDQFLNSNNKKGFTRSTADGKEIRPQQKDSRPPISSHNRPRINYIPPSRKLRTSRHCRPYEALRKGGKCVPKKGKKGVYEHRNHVYGLQRRHRHYGSKSKAKKDHTTNKPEPN